MATKQKKEKLTLREQLASDDKFKKNCESAGVEATTRQLSKFKLKKGKAYNYINKSYA